MLTCALGFGMVAGLLFVCGGSADNAAPHPLAALWTGRTD